MGSRARTFEHGELRGAARATCSNSNSGVGNKARAVLRIHRTLPPKLACIAVYDTLYDIGYAIS